MNVFMRSVVTSILLLVACSVGRAYDHPAPTAGDPYEVVIRDHAMFLNELSNRRRVNTFFPNQQSSFYGIQFRYVNSSRGSLTFVRRDLVTVGRIPIVVGRVYDSMSRKDEGFGPGWRLSLAETVSVLADGTLRYIDDSGSETILVRRRGSYAPAVPGPSDFLSLEMRDDQLRLETRGGWTRVFSRRDDQYVLTAIRDAYGNTMRLRHGALGLAHIAAPNGRFVAIERGASGRIQRVYDDQERVLSYTYNERGLLRTVTDFGGNEWRYDYDEFGRLKLAVDPQNVSILEAQSDARHRATSVRVLGSKFDYRYEVGRTTIRDEAGRSTIVAHNRFGTTTSVTSASGFLSQVQLDTRNRVTSLSHNSRPMATLSYREDGQLATLTRFDESGPTRFSYTYDASNRPTEIASSDGLVIALAYNPAGDLVRKQNGVYWHQFEYSEYGDLSLVSNGQGVTSYTHNADGQIEAITSSHGNTRLTYFPNGRLKLISFADGSVHEYHYNALGLRESVVRSNGQDIAYWYDPAGNLIRSVGFDASGRDVGQLFEIDDFYRANLVYHDSGHVTKVTYDSAGNPATIASSLDPAAPVLNYTYDASNRLVAVAEGEKIIGSYVYVGAEADLRDQMDHHTMQVAVTSVRHSATVGNIDSLVYTRPYGSPLGYIRVNEGTQILEVSGDFGIVLPDLDRDSSIERQELSEIDVGGVEARVSFDRPSNITFVPPEYATINCAQNCVFYGIQVRANGSYTPITIPFGSTVAFAAGSPQGTTNQGCQHLICDWYDNGVPIGFGKFFNYTFQAAGTHDVSATCECSPCDLTGADSILVNVSPCATGIALQTQTQATVPADRARTTLGVGEIVTLTLNPAPPCAVTWSKSGNGTISATSGNSITFTAHERAGITTVTANVGGTNRTATFTVVEPQSESAVKISETIMTPGVAGAGMTLQITIAPTNVSFERVESQEVPGPASNITGYFLQFSASQLAHSTAGWVPVASGNLKFDNAGTSGLPSPWSPGGGFQWVIPIQWRVINGSYIGTLPNRVQTFSITSNGTVTVSKMGQSVTRSP